MCCFPVILLFEVGFLGLVAIASILIVYFGHTSEEDVLTKYDFAII